MIVLRELRSFCLPYRVPLFTVRPDSLSKNWQNVDGGILFKGNMKKQREKKSGIYAIVNITNGHKYIGQSLDLAKRKEQHFKDLASNRHANKYLQNAYNLHGKAFFSFTIIEYLDDPSGEMLGRLLNEREQYWINKNKPEYNLVNVVGDEADELQAKFIIEQNDVLVLKRWQKYKAPAWNAWVYGGARNPKL